MNLDPTKTIAKPLSALMRWIFAGSATLTIFALAMIIFLLFRESIGFFPEYRKSIADYRRSGLEYVELLNERYTTFIELDHQLMQLRARKIRHLQRQSLSPPEMEAALHSGPLSALFARYRHTAKPLRDYIEEKRIYAIRKRTERRLGETIDAGTIETFLREDLNAYAHLLDQLERQTKRLFEDVPAGSIEPPALKRQILRLEEQNRNYHASRDPHLQILLAWDGSRPVRWRDTVQAFFFGTEWTTASEQQNWYGLLPLLTGSLFVALIAVCLATPIGVGSAIYVNMLAGRREQMLLKPGIEFISALPAVVVGFFGVMVFGEAVQTLSRLEFFTWLPFFEIQERLNAFTAGALLALMAIPTIFTLTEDALFAVRPEIKAASFAMGASRMQTAFRVVIPSARSGIISAVLLGFGRVIGETMIVLLCAGNRVRIPELSSGLSALFDPVHTMTGMIAQEMGEVLYGNLHYRALFMVGLVLFVISLVINYTAQSFAERHRQAQNRYRQ